MSLDNIDSIIFDLDGTLWNPLNVCIKAWHTVLSEYKFIKEEISKETIMSCFGMKHDKIGKVIFPYLTEEQLQTVMSSCFLFENELIERIGGDLYDDLENTLSELSKRYKLYIVSNCQAGYIEAFYAYHKLDNFFLDQECSGNTNLEKSYNIKMIIERNDLKSPVYIGDTEGDYLATKENKIPFIFASYGFGKLVNSKYKVNKLSELLKIL